MQTEFEAEQLIEMQKQIGDIKTHVTVMNTEMGQLRDNVKSCVTTISKLRLMVIANMVVVIIISPSSIGIFGSLLKLLGV